MEPNASPKLPKEKKGLNWPIGVNLGILVLAVLLSGGDLGILPFAVLGLAVVNVVAAFIMSLFGSMKWVVAFVLSALLILLIGLGICALMLQGIHGGH